MFLFQSGKNSGCYGIFSLLWLYLVINQASVYRTIGPLIFKITGVYNIVLILAVKH